MTKPEPRRSQPLNRDSNEGLWLVWEVVGGGLFHSVKCLCSSDPIIHTVSVDPSEAEKVSLDFFLDSIMSSPITLDVCVRVRAHVCVCLYTLYGCVCMWECCLLWMVIWQWNFFILIAVFFVSSSPNFGVILFTLTFALSSSSSLCLSSSWLSCWPHLLCSTATQRCMVLPWDFTES